MALEKEELRRRLAAARELVGCDQVAMGRRLKAAGLGVSDAKRLERGSLEFSDSHRMAYARITGLPEVFFEAEDWRPLLRESPEVTAAESPVTQADFQVFQIEQNEALGRVHTELADVRRLLDHAKEEPGDGN